MLNYVNGFSVASDSQHKTFIINLLQETPDIREDGSIGDNSTPHVLGTYIADRDVVIQLAVSILNVIEEENDNPDDTEDIEQDSK